MGLLSQEGGGIQHGGNHADHRPRRGLMLSNSAAIAPMQRPRWRLASTPGPCFRSWSLHDQFRLLLAAMFLIHNPARMVRLPQGSVKVDPTPQELVIQWKCWCENKARVCEQLYKCSVGEIYKTFGSGS